MRQKIVSLLILLNLLMFSIVVFYKFQAYNNTYPVVISYNYPSVLTSSKQKTEETEPHTIKDNAEKFEEELEDVKVSFPLDLNTATKQQLMLIPKIGDATSKRIIQYREHLGGYSDLSQLMEIKGIGSSTYSQISAYLYIQENAWNIENDKASKQ